MVEEAVYRRVFFVYDVVTRTFGSLVDRPLVVEDAGKRESFEEKFPSEIRLVWRLLRRFF